MYYNCGISTILVLISLIYFELLATATLMAAIEQSEYVDLRAKIECYYIKPN